MEHTYVGAKTLVIPLKIISRMVRRRAVRSQITFRQSYCVCFEINWRKNYLSPFQGCGVLH